MELTIREQADLLTLNRRSVEYQPSPPAAEEVTIKHAIDTSYTAQPCYGSRRIGVILQRDHHLVVNRKGSPSLSVKAQNEQIGYNGTLIIVNLNV